MGYFSSVINLEKTKWDKVLLSVNTATGITCYRSPEACKYKWQTLLLEYKWVVNLHNKFDVVFWNDIWAKKRDDVIKKNLPPCVHNWLKHKSTMNPLHFRDLFNPNDRNFVALQKHDHLMKIEVGNQSPLLRPHSQATIHAYASAAAYKVVPNSFNECHNILLEIIVFAIENQILPRSTTPSLHAAFTATI